MIPTSGQRISPTRKPNPCRLHWEYRRVRIAAISGYHRVKTVKRRTLSDSAPYCERPADAAQGKGKDEEQEHLSPCCCREMGSYGVIDSVSPARYY